jgi:hypothetical protein
MSVTAPAPEAPALPLFFHRVVGVNPELHGNLRLDRSAGYGFAAKAQTLPIGLGEFEMAARHYPIVFTSGPAPMPVALVGLNETGNLFVGADGAWRIDAYVPAYARAFPFIFVEDTGADTTYVGMEADAACLKTDTGQRLFEDGKPTQVLNEAIGFCSALRDNLRAGATLAKALDAAGLLREEEATVNFTAGGSARIRGFKVMQPDRLDGVSDETFLDWRRRGWLGPIYAHLHSAAYWGRLIDLAAARAT